MSIKSGFTAMAVVILLLSCSCENENNPTQQPGTKKAYGVFSLFINQNTNTVSFFGRLEDGPAPVVVWDTVMTSGECWLVKPKLKSCYNCGIGYICVDDNNCQPEPDTITVGTVTVMGFTTRAGTTTCTMTPAHGAYQPTGNNRLANPPCTEGGTISLTASGNQSVTGFTLSARTISKIEISEDTIPMNPGEDVHLTWKPAANQTDSRINVIVDLLCIGGTEAKIECDCPDDGELTIPAKMLDSLKTFGMSGNPIIEIYRKSVGTNPTTGVQLMIQAHAMRLLKIPGLITCTSFFDTSNCPSGMTCVNARCVDANDTTQ
jgi:hypothetical protein